MSTTRRIGALVTGFILSCGSLAGAQSLLDEKIFINVNVGAQTQARTVDNAFSLPIYGQTASVATTTTVDGGAIFDISGGYKLTRNIGVAVDYTTFSVTGATAGAASVPSPIFFNHPASVTIPESPADRKDRSVSVLFVGFVPVGDKIDLALSIGPSFTHVEQTMITNVTIPNGTQNVNPTIETQSGTANGVNVGADLIYMFLKQAGAGVFVRYNGGSVDLPSAPGLKAGGFQTGVGLRLRF